MNAQDVMTTPVLSVTAGTTLKEIARILVEKRISGLPVIDDGGIPIGMITEKDLIALDAGKEREAGREWWLSHLAEGEALSPQFLAQLDHAERLARDIMASPVISVSETTELAEIARLLIEHRIKQLPVVRDGRIVGIVSRADLVRLIAKKPAKIPTTAPSEGFVSEAITSLEEHFDRSPPSPTPVDAKKEEPDAMTATATAFDALVQEFDHQKAYQHDEAQLAATERRKALVKDLIDHHINDGNWADILRRAQAAAEAGQKELLLLRFPCELCSDGGRAVNVPLPEWPETLRGEAAEIYRHWEQDLKPNGFHLIAQVLDFPGGIPGDIGLTLVWGG